uniref:Uncharacterized protein n=1 Tax=Glossina morsitans morsitans TaxID=37546 RepID=A0A1B0G6X2_GLOMM
MVRQRQRKSIEELYGSKYDASKSQVTNNASKNPRTERDYGYIITSSTPYNSGGPIPATNTNSNSGNGAASTARRKSARTTTVKGAEKYYSKDEKILNLDDLKKDHNIIKSKTSRVEKCPYTTSTNMYDNKTCGSVYTERHKESGGEAVGSHQHSHQQHSHPHQHQHHHHNHNHRTASHDDDKDDDTEEFFELIRQTVESAIGRNALGHFQKSISDLLNRNFRELATKVERFSSELKNTNTLLNKLQTDLNNKVVHYGEENSRHFRYLCMKSEYDKMFYQHQSMIAAVAPSATSQQVDKRSSGAKANTSNILGATVADNDKTNAPTPIPCTCRSNKSNTANEYKELAHKQSSEDHSLSQKSSEMGMREVLEHIQRFCTQMQLNDLKCDHLPPNVQSSMKRGVYRREDALKINEEIFQDDDDDLEISSDGMTPRSDENNSHKYGANTMRGCNTTRGGTGGGDA